MNLRVLVIVLPHTGIALTLDCLALQRRVVYPAREVAVVDNASADGTQAIVRKRLPEMRVIETGANLGCAAGHLGMAPS